MFHRQVFRTFRTVNDYTTGESKRVEIQVSWEPSCIILKSGEKIKKGTTTNKAEVLAIFEEEDDYFVSYENDEGQPAASLIPKSTIAEVEYIRVTRTLETPTKKKWTFKSLFSTNRKKKG